MEEVKIFCKNLIGEHYNASTIFKRNLIKEYLQILVLDYIYTQTEYSNLIFYGGSCLAHCFGLSRLSEDLDFVDRPKKINLRQLAGDLNIFVRAKTGINLSTKVQKFRIYLKFPILRELGLASSSESDLLFLKIEIFPGLDVCEKHRTEIRPIFKFNKSILIKTFDLPTLFATKIRAILYRQWEKTDKKSGTVIKVKGRDYYDLLWYLQKAVKPNLSCLREFKNLEQLKIKLLEIIERVDTRSIVLDLESLVEDEKFVVGLGRDIKEILRREIQEKL